MRHLQTIFLTIILLTCDGCSLLRNRDVASDSVALPSQSASTDTLREACIRSCNHDHEMCSAGPSSRNDTFDAPKQVLGASAACDQDLRSCLRNCR